MIVGIIIYEKDWTVKKIFKNINEISSLAAMNEIKGRIKYSWKKNFIFENNLAISLGEEGICDAKKKKPNLFCKQNVGNSWILHI